MRNRFLFQLEEFITSLWLAQWPSRFPDWFEEIWAGVFLVLINATRRARFGVHCVECEGCGIVFPKDDLHTRVKSDGNSYPECTSCERFGDLIRAIHLHRPEAA